MVRLCIAHVDNFSMGVGGEAGNGNFFRGGGSDCIVGGLAPVCYRSRPCWRRLGSDMAQAA